MVADVHVDQCNLETADQLVYPKGFGAVSGKGIVKNPAIDEGAFVVAGDDASWSYRTATGPFLYDLVVNASTQTVYPFVQSDSLQELLVLQTVIFLALFGHGNYLLLTINAAITPGTQPHRVSNRVMRMEPQPLSITANGGKTMQSITLIRLMFLCCFVFVGAKVMLFFRTPKDTAVFKGKLFPHQACVFSLAHGLDREYPCLHRKYAVPMECFLCMSAAFRQGPDNKIHLQMLCRPYNII